ncbi:MAG: SpoIIE family protein phosphatase [Paraclostridium sp.]|uniref:SpoIIE family protein phosphatase n=1 Tax=Paraclostridium sp. TaxID=2023273 RepID=UPI003F2BE347
MEYFIDFSSRSMNKYNEELCGDKVEFFYDEKNFIVILSDGLGSGVKANILATLTSKIAITMLKEGSDIYEVVDTIAKTLPVCSQRKLAYSTFTIINIDNKGMVYMAEFDNPSVFYLSGGTISEINWKTVKINNRLIKESRFEIKENDIMVIASDGVIYAGTGKILNLNWKWSDVSDYIKKFINWKMTSKEITDTLIGVCDQLYMQKPGDDTTVATIKVVKPKYTTLISGPPKDKNKDKEIVNMFINSKGNKIVCGGTTAQIVARELGEKINTNFDIIDDNVPPIAYIKGINLVTEGILTLTETIKKIERVKIENNLNFLDKEDGASKLAKIIFEKSTHIKIIVGGATNIANKNICLNKDINKRIELLEQLKDILLSLGKIVEICYC